MSSNLLSWIITIAFAVVLVAGFLVGMWRGAKRSVVNLVISIVGAIIAFFVTSPITNAILGITINTGSGETTIQGAIINLFRSEPNIDAMMNSNKNLEIFFNNLPAALFNVVIFILLTSVMQLVLYIVYKILAVTVFKVKKDDNKHKFLGGFIGLGKTLIIVLFAFMPLSSLVGIANTMMVSGDYGITANAETQNKSFLEGTLPESVSNIVVGLEDNLLIKMCGMFGVDDALFDYYSSFEVDGEKLYVRQEIDNIYKIVDFSYQVANIDINQTDFENVEYDKIITAVEKTTNSTLFKKILSETLADLIINYQDYSFIANSVLAKDYADILNNVGAHLEELKVTGDIYTYFENDISKLFSMFKILGKNGVISDIASLENRNVENILKVITSSENEDNFNLALSSLLDLNIVRDGIVTFAQKGLDAILTDIGKIGADANEWTDDDWANFEVSLSSILKDFCDISSEIDVLSVLEDPTTILDEQKKYNIDFITTTLGSMIDNLRANKLLQNTEGAPIIDSLLEKNDISLPENAVIDENGESVNIDNYSQYFNFIKAPLLKLRDKGVYKLVTDTTLSAEGIIEGLADILSTNPSLLSEIILPLYQVQPTKTLIVDQLSSSLQSDLINFSVLTDYTDWKTDLGYIEDMLVVLNSLDDGSETFLSLALNGNIQGVVDNLSEENVDNVLKPILYAKSTAQIKETLFANIKSQLDNVSGADSTLSLSGVTFIEGNDEDQAVEVCNIFKKMISVNKAVEAGGTIKTIDKEMLGNLLETMKTNAYRVDLTEKTEEGIFKNCFIDLVNKFKSEYSAEVAYIESQPALLAELGVDNLQEENYKNINYVQLLSLLAGLEQN